MLLTIAIPTRNRSDLLRHALDSVARLDDARLRVIVSDNSTDEVEVEAVTRLCRTYSRVRYMRPPTPLPMSEHWEWILQRVRADDQLTTHLAYLTDRMAFRDGALELLLSAMQRTPTAVVSFTYDRIDDTKVPVELRTVIRSGRLFEVESERLLAGSAQMSFGSWLPRMLNCVVPMKVLDAITARFGDVFRSVSPDFCFCYRCLATVPEIKYLDKALLLNFGLSRSNGASMSRGLPSKDSADFLRNVAVREMNEFAPLPAVLTVGNAIVSEYCRVRAAAPTQFPPLSAENYLRMLALEVEAFAVGLRKSESAMLLESAGWRPDGSFRLQQFRTYVEQQLTTVLGSRFARMEDAINYARRTPPRELTLLARLMGRYRRLKSASV